LGAGLLIASAALMLLAAERGEVTFSLFIVFPVITATGPVGAMGLLLLPAALLFLFLSLVPEGRPAERETVSAEGEAESSYGGVVLIGPIPILFGSAKGLRGTRLLAVLVAAATVLTVVMLLIVLR